MMIPAWGAVRLTSESRLVTRGILIANEPFCRVGCIGRVLQRSWEIVIASEANHSVSFMTPTHYCIPS